MQRPVEINQKKTRLLQIAALGLGVAAILTWVHYDELLPFSWDAVFHAIGIVITSITGLTALVALAISLFRHEPYLLVYDDRIVLERRDFENDLPAGPDWVVPLPASAEPFSARAEKSTAPEFAHGAAVKIARIKGENRAKKKTEQEISAIC